MCLGTLAQILSIEETKILRPALVAVGRVQHEVSVICLPDAKPGDYVLVHAGMGISLLSEEDVDQRTALRERAVDGGPSRGAPRR